MARSRTLSKLCVMVGALLIEAAVGSSTCSPGSICAFRFAPVLTGTPRSVPHDFDSTNMDQLKTLQDAFVSFESTNGGTASPCANSGAEFTPVSADNSDANEIMFKCVEGTYQSAERQLTLSRAAAPTAAPTEAPTATPTEAPTAAPTEAPTAAPTEAPTAAPTEAPTAATTTATPSAAPTAATTTATPSAAPTATPTTAPTIHSDCRIDARLARCEAGGTTNVFKEMCRLYREEYIERQLPYPNAVDDIKLDFISGCKNKVYGDIDECEAGVRFMTESMPTDLFPGDECNADEISAGCFFCDNSARNGGIWDENNGYTTPAPTEAPTAAPTEAPTTAAPTPPPVTNCETFSVFSGDSLLGGGGLSGTYTLVTDGTDADIEYGKPYWASTDVGPFYFYCGRDTYTDGDSDCEWVFSLTPPNQTLTVDTAANALAYTTRTDLDFMNFAAVSDAAGNLVPDSSFKYGCGKTAEGVADCSQQDTDVGPILMVCKPPADGPLWKPGACRDPEPEVEFVNPFAQWGGVADSCEAFRIEFAEWGFGEFCLSTGYVSDTADACSCTCPGRGLTPASCFSDNNLRLGELVTDGVITVGYNPTDEPATCAGLVAYAAGWGVDICTAGFGGLPEAKKVCLATCPLGLDDDAAMVAAKPGWAPAGDTCVDLRAAIEAQGWGDMCTASWAAVFAQHCESTCRSGGYGSWPCNCVDDDAAVAAFTADSSFFTGETCGELKEMVATSYGPNMCTFSGFGLPEMAAACKETCFSDGACPKPQEGTPAPTPPPTRDVTHGCERCLNDPDSNTPGGDVLCHEGQYLYADTKFCDAIRDDTMEDYQYAYTFEGVALYTHRIPELCIDPESNERMGLVQIQSLGCGDGSDLCPPVFTNDVGGCWQEHVCGTSFFELCATDSGYEDCTAGLCDLPTAQCLDEINSPIVESPYVYVPPAPTEAPAPTATPEPTVAPTAAPTTFCSAHSDICVRVPHSGGYTLSSIPLDVYAVTSTERVFTKIHEVLLARPAIDNKDVTVHVHIEQLKSSKTKEELQAEVDAIAADTYHVIESESVSSQRRLSQGDQIYEILGTTTDSDGLQELLVLVIQLVDSGVPTVQIDIDTQLESTDLIDAIELADPERVPVRAWVMFDSTDTANGHCTPRSNDGKYDRGEISVYRAQFMEENEFFPEFYLPHCTWGQDFADKGFTTYALSWLDVCNHTFAIDPDLNEQYVATGDDDRFSAKNIAENRPDERLRVGPIAPEFFADCGNTLNDLVDTTLYRCVRYHQYSAQGALDDDFLNPVSPPTITPVFPTYAYETHLLNLGWTCEHQTFSWERTIDRLPTLESHRFDLDPDSQGIFRDYDDQDEDAKVDLDVPDLTSSDLDERTCANLVDENRYGLEPTAEYDSCTRFPDAKFLLGWGFKTTVQINDEPLVELLEAFDKFYKATLDHMVVTQIKRTPESDFVDVTGAELITPSDEPLDPFNPFGSKVGFDGQFFHVKQDGARAVDRIVKNQFILTGLVDDHHILEALKTSDASDITTRSQFEAAKVDLVISLTPYSCGDDPEECDDPQPWIGPGLDVESDQGGSRRRLRAVAEPRQLQVSSVVTVPDATGPIDVAQMDVRRAALIFGSAYFNHTLIKTAHDDFTPKRQSTNLNEHFDFAADGSNALEFGNAYFNQYLLHTGNNFDELFGQVDGKTLNQFFYTMEVLKVWDVKDQDGVYGLDFQMRVQEADYTQVKKLIDQAHDVSGWPLHVLSPSDSDADTGVKLFNATKGKKAQPLHDSDRLSDKEERSHFDMVIGIVVGVVVLLMLVVFVSIKVRNADAGAGYKPVPVLGPAKLDF